MPQTPWTNWPSCANVPAPTGTGTGSQCCSSPSATPGRLLTIDGSGGSWWINPLVHLGLKIEHEVLHPLALSLYWLAALALGLLATVWWYRWRAARVGVETSTSAYVQVAVSGLVVVLLGVPLGISLFFEYSSIWPGVPITMVAMALLLGLAFLALRARRWRPVLVPVALLLISIALTLLGLPDIGVDLGMGGMAQFVVIALGLLVLAWLERSALCTAIAVLFAVAVVVANNFPLDIGPSFGATVENAQDVLLPAAVLVVGGIVALLTRRRVSR
jgi:hypothetical protein